MIIEDLKQSFTALKYYFISPEIVINQLENINRIKSQENSTHPNKVYAFVRAYYD